MNKRGIPILIIAALLLLAGGVIWAADVGGGDDDSPLLQAEVTRTVSPPTVTYGDVVATVNGSIISGEALAQVEAIAAAQAETWPTNLPLMQGDPLDCIINQFLVIQAADRLGLEPTRAEVEEYAQSWERSLNDLPPEQRLEFEALMAAQGLPSSDFAANERLFISYEGALKRVNLTAYIKGQVAAEQSIAPEEVTSWDMAEAQKDFLAVERRAAEIVVLVARPTPTPAPPLAGPTPFPAPLAATSCF